MAVMDASLMRPNEAATCRWVGCEFRKGVTHPRRCITAIAKGDDALSGLHGTLIQPFGNVDPTPRCYDRDAPVGFGGFVRWVRFERPNGRAILGIDWSPSDLPTIGVGTSALEVALVARAIDRSIVDGDDELALLTPRMTEEEIMRAWRASEGLVTVQHWSDAVGRFSPGTEYCPACGQRTFSDSTFRFCHQCGADPHHVWRHHGLETL